MWSNFILVWTDSSCIVERFNHSSYLQILVFSYPSHQKKSQIEKSIVFYWGSKNIQLLLPPYVNSIVQPAPTIT